MSGRSMRHPRWVRARKHFFRSPQRDGIRFGLASEPLVDLIREVRAKRGSTFSLTADAGGYIAGMVAAARRAGGGSE